MRVFEGGELRESYGVDRAPRAIGGSDVDAYRTFVETYVAEPRRPDHLAALEHERRPDLLPGYDRVVVTDEGRVWAQVHETDLLAPHEWDVYDAERRFVGTVRVWAGFRPMVIARDAVTGIWSDSLGVEHVRAYRLVREASR